SGGVDHVPERGPHLALDVADRPVTAPHERAPGEGREREPRDEAFERTGLRPGEQVVDGPRRRDAHPVGDGRLRRAPRQRCRNEQGDVDQDDRSCPRERPLAWAKAHATLDGRDERSQNVREERRQQTQDAEPFNRSQHAPRSYNRRQSEERMYAKRLVLAFLLVAVTATKTSSGG